VWQQQDMEGRRVCECKGGSQLLAPILQLHLQMQLPTWCCLHPRQCTAVVQATQDTETAIDVCDSHSAQDVLTPEAVYLRYICMGCNTK
jgi:hypothetical protein